MHHHALRTAGRVLRRDAQVSKIVVPALAQPVFVERHPTSWRQSFDVSARLTRHLHTSTRALSALAARVETPRSDDRVDTSLLQEQLPVNCPGCGAHTQFINADDAGYYSSTRKVVKALIQDEDAEPGNAEREDEVFRRAMQNASSEVLQQMGLDESALRDAEQRANQQDSVGPPVCDRCHNLIHHHTGVSIHHPSIESIEDTILESPHKHNHIYHVIDAADFPMSVIPDIEKRLDVARLRTKNRRARNHAYSHGKETTLHFVITRSDLLAPQKEMVDRMYATLVEILREKLSGRGRDVRLGNVTCVSAKRGWWTKSLKDEIYRNGGAAWLVGRVNVGKSNLFESIYPKSRTGYETGFRRPLEHSSAKQELQADPWMSAMSSSPQNVLLPPSQTEVQYPVMPVISALSGTTASPIRIPFGQGRGELIDLPGVSRRNLEDFVKAESRTGLVMKSRVAAERIVIKPGSTLLLGGLISITAKGTEDVVIMAHNFTPLSEHLTSTIKAQEALSGGRTIGQELDHLQPETASKIKSAGLFKLSTDVTKKYAGPLTRRDAVGLKAQNLPFVVYATDILIEGCGWVELVAQVRRRRKVDAFDALSEELPEDRGLEGMPDCPEVEIYSPEGKFIGQRRSLSAWLVNRPLTDDKKKTRGAARPRMSMRSAKGRRSKEGL